MHAGGVYMAVGALPPYHRKQGGHARWSCSLCRDGHVVVEQYRAPLTELSLRARHVLEMSREAVHGSAVGDARVGHEYEHV